jgi:hypothetical protein
MPDTTLSTLANIQTKVRRLTRSPSVSQITDAQLNDYINTFLLYDFPEHLRMGFMRTNLTFWTSPYVGEYTDNTVDVDSPLYNLKNQYISFHPPAYIAGYQAFLSESREQFYGIYPQVASISQIAQGDGVTVFYAGTLASHPILQNNVTFSSVDTANNGLVLRDIPNITVGGIMDTVGGLYVPNNPVVQGTINYVTGAYTFAFVNPPAVGVKINSQTLPYQPALPQAIMFYKDTFHVRPIPDQPYEIKIEAYIRPTELLAGGNIPELSEWWQYIAYGAAKKIFEDRMDLESVQQIMPEFKEQETLINRRTIDQQSDQRSATIYTENVGPTPGGFGSGWGSGQF